MKILKDFYRRSSLEVAPDLLGLSLVHNTNDGVFKGKIVEVEAYMGTKDVAAHSYSGKPTPRTQVMYGDGGFAYVYLIYGMYYCMNVVTNKIDIPEAVLIRAVEPLEGIDIMRQRRKKNKLTDLCNGPGKLCQSMGITKADNGVDLTGDHLYLEKPEQKEDFTIERSKRINIDYAKEARDYLWRFTIADSPFISVKRR